MSHENDPSGVSRERPAASVFAPTTLVRRLKRHLREWPRRYVEMRTEAVERRT